MSNALTTVERSLTDLFERTRAMDVTSFEDISKRVDRARGLIEYRDELTKTLKHYGDGSRITEARLTMIGRLDDQLHLFSHDGRVTRSGRGYQGKEDRLMETFRFVFLKTIETEMQRIADELRALNVGL